MRTSAGHLLLSPSDVVAASACSHAAFTALRAAHGVDAADPSPVSATVARLGAEHEREVTADLAAARRLVALDERTPDAAAWHDLAARTLALLAPGSGVEVVAQGALVVELGRGMDGGSAAAGALLVGRPDLLVATPDGWRVEDAKLARSLRATAVLQTMLYRDALAAAGVPVHDDVRLHLGSGEVLDVPARSGDAWARRQLADVLALLDRLRAGGALAPGASHPPTWCASCGPDSACARTRARADHLSGVADLRRDAGRKLEAAGITTMAGLAGLGAPAGAGVVLPRVPGLSPSALAALHEQAALQVRARDGAPGAPVPVRLREHPARVRPRSARPGLWLLPDPDPGDVFFDMEGDPHYVEGARGRRTFGLEYLFGATHDGDAFTPFWGHDRAGERAAFTAFVDWVQERREQHPGLHVYHYAAYERSALARLAAAHATRADVVDDWLRAGVMVDLYAAVRGGLRAGVPSYSIKKVEALYGRAHAGDVATAGESVEQYEAWRSGRDPAVLAAIADYNRDDCESTRDLRDYLLALRAGALERGDLAPLVVEPEDDGAADAADAAEAPASARAQLRAELAERAEALLAGADPGQPVQDPAAESRRLLAGLLGYHVREEKAVWQDVLRVADDLAVAGPAGALDDPAVLGGLELAGVEVVRGRTVATYTAPVQEHRLAVGSALAVVGGAPVGVGVSALAAPEEGGGAQHLTVAVGLSAAVVAGLGLGPGAAPQVQGLLASGSVDATALQTSLLALADELGTGPTGPRSAARALLLGSASLAGPLPPALAGEDPVEHVVRLARGASTTGPGMVIAVQGPPGAGKSHLGTRVVDALLADAAAGGGAGASGRRLRIGVTANSHAVVQHLLLAVHERTPTAVVRHKRSGHSAAKDPGRWTRLCEHAGEHPCASPVLVTANGDGWADADVVGGTAWAFSPEGAPELDWLVVDEAGQMGLGDVLAAARRARHLLLLGDPQQLAKPSRAAHPPGVGASALEHLMAGSATIEAGTGVFLPSTRRMHADVADFISAISYAGRLSAHPSTAGQRVLPLVRADLGGSPPDDPLSGTGLRWAPVATEGDVQGSDAECAVVVDLVRQLLRRRWVDGSGREAALSPADVLVVSPYNVQVRRLRAALEAAAAAGGEGGDDAALASVAVGTVDRFQGQEGVAVVYSTASSDADAAPRGLGFLYDVHRLNVAVSRARCLAVWVGSPALLRPGVSSAEQVPLVDAHCRFVEGAREVPVTPSASR